MAFALFAPCRSCFSCLECYKDLYCHYYSAIGSLNTEKVTFTSHLIKLGHKLNNYFFSLWDFSPVFYLLIIYLFT